MRITVYILKDQLLKESQITKKASQIRGEEGVGYHKSLRMATKLVSDVDHSIVINCRPGKDINPEKIAEHIACGRSHRFSADV